MMDAFRSNDLVALSARNLLALADLGVDVAPFPAPPRVEGPLRPLPCKPRKPRKAAEKVVQ
jgi:hypothetical protein